MMVSSFQVSATIMGLSMFPKGKTWGIPRDFVF
jgi:hypothetical protein